MDFKSILIGGLGTALLFVSIGAGNLETQRPEWEPFKIVSGIEKNYLERHIQYSFDVLMVKYNPDRIDNSTGEKFVDPKKHWEYSIGHRSLYEDRRVRKKKP